MKTTILIIALSIALYANAFCETSQFDAVKVPKNHRFSVSTTYLSFANFGEEKTNTHHYELHLGYQLSSKDRIGLKLATWKLFAPMGMPMAEQLEFDEANFYPGRLRETGLGVSYQRKLWKGLFVSAEILPQLKTYLDEDNHKLAGGFKLYTSYHLGYHISLFKERIYLEPQIHCQYWPTDTNVPAAFKVKDDEWNNYFLFELNLYLGVNLDF
jgi:hypothetical protein